MRSDHRTPATPSTEDMSAAWRELAKRDWPPLEELARAAALYRLVLGAAQRRAAGLARVVQTPAPPPAPQPASGASARPVPLPHHPPVFDHKRAASGEREDE